MQETNKARILIVDDVAENIHVLMEVLRTDYQVVPARSGQVALQKAMAEPQPDLILLDILMPEMDGYEVCQKLKGMPQTKDIPVIYITSVSDAIDEAKGFRLGAVDYITKPFHPDVVKARVKAHLELRRKSELLEKLAMRDALTDVYNRRRFDEVVGQEWDRAFRQKKTLALAMLDIDCFKPFNDNYGHAAGDACLRRVARCMDASLLRPMDFLARYGGEEFVVLLADTDYDGAMRVTRRMLDDVSALQINHQYSDASDTVTLSAGVCVVSPFLSGGSPLELVEHADKMLYESKHNGRNCVTGLDMVEGVATFKV